MSSAMTPLLFCALPAAPPNATPGATPSASPQEPFSRHLHKATQPGNSDAEVVQKPMPAESKHKRGPALDRADAADEAGKSTDKALDKSPAARRRAAAMALLARGTDPNTAPGLQPTDPVRPDQLAGTDAGDEADRDAPKTTEDPAGTALPAWLTAVLSSANPATVPNAAAASSAAAASTQALAAPSSDSAATAPDSRANAGTSPQGAVAVGPTQATTAAVTDADPGTALRAVLADRTGRGATRADPVATRPEAASLPARAEPAVAPAADATTAPGRAEPSSAARRESATDAPPAAAEKRPAADAPATPSAPPGASAPQPALILAALPQAVPQAADNLAALAGAAFAGGAAPAAAAAGETPRNLSVMETRLQAPLGSPEFAPQLGAQVSMMVRDGVQHARLHMTPAEMGPISVQIQLDGNNAQIHMAAEHAATRQALEQAMPTLAGSMREAGLTLTGGGVFEQPRQPRDEAAAPPPQAGTGNRGGALGDGPLVTGPLPQVLRPGRGMLDLYA